MLFTAETAAEYARRSHEARKAAKLRSTELSQSTPTDPLNAIPAYTLERLIRVRKQLDRIDEMMMAESDPQRLDRLASAQARLSEQERTLDGRPLPGSMRPSKATSTRRPTVSPIEPETPPTST